MNFDLEKTINDLKVHRRNMKELMNNDQSMINELNNIDEIIQCLKNENVQMLDFELKK